MKLMPSLNPVSVAGGALGLRRAAMGKLVPEGVLPAETAGFDDPGAWALDPDWSVAASAVSKAAGTAARYVTSPIINIPEGTAWVAFTLRDATAGTVGPQLQGPFRNNPFATKLTAQHVARFSSAGHTRVRLNADAAFDGTVDDLQVVDMTDILAQPADIYIAAGQSLIAAETSGGPVAPELDFWIPRCLYIPGYTNPALGSVAGQVHACVAPLQMAQVSIGVSPATTFARTVEKKTPTGRSVLVLACARGGTKLVGNDAEWNPDGNVGAGGSSYANMLSQAQAALALNPGNQIKALIWGQGESDRGATMDLTYPIAFQSMLGTLRADLSQAGLPVLLIGPEPDDTDPHQAIFLQTQARFDAASGHATATSGVHYIARPPGYLSADGTHPVAEGHRIAGRLAAQRFLGEGYLNP